MAVGWIVLESCLWEVGFGKVEESENFIFCEGCDMGKVCGKMWYFLCIS